MNVSPGERLGGIAVAIATPIVVVALAVVVFFNPVWIYFEQDRAGAPAVTGLSAAQVRDVTGAILHDLVFGPPTFDVTVDGRPYLDARERSHMRNVRDVFAEVGLVALVALAVLLGLAIVAAARHGGRWFWAGVRAGAGVLVGAVVVVGLAFLVAFDRSFELFHSLFFPAGSFDFDPRTEHLVQLFPDQFWSETFPLAAFVVLALAVGAVFVAGRRMRPRGEAARVTRGSAA